MGTNDRLFEIIRELGDYRDKVAALYSLYNNCLLQAEEELSNLSSCYEKLVDNKNDLTVLSKDLSLVSKKERGIAYSKNRIKINIINESIKDLNAQFLAHCKHYREALKECGSYKAEYKHNVSTLCQEFKGILPKDADTTLIKSFNQQVKLIKAILDKIECLISDYNVRKNKMEKDNANFEVLYNSVNDLIVQMEKIA